MKLATNLATNLAVSLAASLHGPVTPADPVNDWLNGRGDLLAHFSPRDPESDGTAPADASTLASYVDRINAHTVTASLSGRRATYRAAGSGAGMGTGGTRACLVLDGIDDCYAGAAGLAPLLSGTNAHTLIVVASTASTSASAGAVGTADGGTHRHGLGRNGSQDVVWHSGSFSNGSVGGSWTVGASVVLVMTFNGTHINTWHNGTQTITNVAATIGAATSFAIGALRDGFTVWNGKIGDVIALSGALGTSDRQAIEAILMNYYA